MPKLAVTNFSRGEFGPELYGRVDLPQYSAGAKSLDNFIIQRYGGVQFRPGFANIGPVFGPIATPAKLVPFQYSIEQSYVIVMRDSAMELAALGGYVVEDNLQLVSATNAVSIVVEIPFHASAIGEVWYFEGNVGMDELNGRFATVTAVPSANHLTFAINSTGFGALTSSTGTTRVGAPTAPVAPEAPPPAPPAAPTPPTVGGSGDEDAPYEGAIPWWKFNNGSGGGYYL